ncbi:hypothetical protein PG_0492 [Porphyromonas gingivalis W83]|uniref:Uncharacterized protein n=1 Tax=Porphyromonas gingivalis (strain ATCC BAA-308 / W83) TaxID=242619 RepID=Q7MWU5_PORGI|nr:hypothetical protein PG_0492 [Porphyromonas gingivalis W83]ATR92100.1 hypothetical protein CS545_02710 [Porphyromonas gingivalis]ATS08954.1 hypothetical protein CS388_07855 [Porphyromonas gingivalis]EIW93391.1 hypothetical protein HMPREF1322_1013 [Porphyromonas gingivalis W50]PDP73751.1 hypothetical protein CLI81_02330 [Porphyromonas gingivalis]
MSKNDTEKILLDDLLFLQRAPYYESFSVYKIDSNKYIENENDSHIDRWLSMAVSGDDKTEAPTEFVIEPGGCLISLVVDRRLISLY